MAGSVLAAKPVALQETKPAADPSPAADPRWGREPFPRLDRDKLRYCVRHHLNSGAAQARRGGNGSDVRSDASRAELEEAALSQRPSPRELSAWPSRRPWRVQGSHCAPRAPPVPRPRAVRLPSKPLAPISSRTRLFPRQVLFRRPGTAPTSASRTGSRRALALARATFGFRELDRSTSKRSDPTAYLAQQLAAFADADALLEARLDRVSDQSDDLAAAQTLRAARAESVPVMELKSARLLRALLFRPPATSSARSNSGPTTSTSTN